ncbi:hypothetical protein KKG36_02205 [Patescibacteria group bacterium]|nr:hypothetical protein [Patescibacteria group bacterium]
MKRLIILCLLVLVVAYFWPKPEKLSDKDISEKALQYITVKTGKEFSLESIEREHGLAKLTFDFEGIKMISHVSSDGKLFFESAVDLENKDNYPRPAIRNNEEVTPLAEPEKLRVFVSCLAEADFMIYGDSECFYTNKLVFELGGKEIVSQIYIECPEESCENITGYPTILIKNKEYLGNHSLEEFSLATGCKIP